MDGGGAGLGHGTLVACLRGVDKNASVSERGSKMKVTIDREECTSCTICWEECPGFFEENEDDEWSQVVAKYRDGDDPAKGEAPPELQDCVREAAESCPVEIIQIEE